MSFKDYITEGGKYSTAPRRQGLSLFEEYLTRPWLGCELTISVQGLEYGDPKVSKEYSIATGKETVKEYRVVRDTGFSEPSQKIHKSLILAGLTVPDIGLGFVVNNALAGHPQPQINYSNLQVRVNLPAARQNKFLNNPESRAKYSSNLGLFGTLYNNQFTSYGTLRINSKKPTIILSLETNVVEGLETFSRKSKHAIQLFEFKRCSFSAPMPSSGDASDLNALSFIVNIAFEDYDIFEGAKSQEGQEEPLPVYGDITVGTGSKESYLSVLAKSKVSAEIAKNLTRALGSGLGYKINL